MGKTVSFLRSAVGLTTRESWFLFQIGAAALLVANYGLQPGTEVGMEWIAVFTFLAVLGGLAFILAAMPQMQTFMSPEQTLRRAELTTEAKRLRDQTKLR